LEPELDDQDKQTTEIDKDEGGKPEPVARVPMSGRRRTLLLLCGAAVCLALVVVLGFYQFGTRAKAPIDLVKSRKIQGTDVTLGQGILAAIKKQGVKVVSEGFRPTWGAEQVGAHRWIVAFVFEIGRQAHWASWTVDTASGTVRPRDELARKLYAGSP
jgi:hypothetical protein